VWHSSGKYLQSRLTQPSFIGETAQTSLEQGFGGCLILEGEPIYGGRFPETLSRLVAESTLELYKYNFIWGQDAEAEATDLSTQNNHKKIKKYVTQMVKKIFLNPVIVSFAWSLPTWILVLPHPTW
jgi:hypothetical protein